MRGTFLCKPVITAILAAFAVCAFAAAMASGWAWNPDQAPSAANAPQAGWAWNAASRAGH